MFLTFYLVPHHMSSSSVIEPFLVECFKEVSDCSELSAAFSKLFVAFFSVSLKFSLLPPLGGFRSDTSISFSFVSFHFVILSLVFSICSVKLSFFFHYKAGIFVVNVYLYIINNKSDFVQYIGLASILGNYVEPSEQLYRQLLLQILSVGLKEVLPFTSLRLVCEIFSYSIMSQILGKTNQMYSFYAV